MFCVGVFEHIHVHELESWNHFARSVQQPIQRYHLRTISGPKSVVLRVTIKITGLIPITVATEVSRRPTIQVTRVTIKDLGRCLSTKPDSVWSIGNDGTGRARRDSSRGGRRCRPVVPSSSSSSLS